MAIAAYQVMREKTVPVFYVDTENERILMLEQPSESFYAPIARLKVKDFVDLVGAAIFRDQTDWFEEDQERLDSLTYLIVANPDRWNSVSQFFSRNNNNQDHEIEASDQVQICV